jgi:hypothetical protein
MQSATDIAQLVDACRSAQAAECSLACSSPVLFTSASLPFLALFQVDKAHSGKSGYRQFDRRSEQLDPDQPQLGLEDLE